MSWARRIVVVSDMTHMGFGQGTEPNALKPFSKPGLQWLTNTVGLIEF